MGGIAVRAGWVGAAIGLITAVVYGTAKTAYFFKRRMYIVVRLYDRPLLPMSYTPVTISVGVLW